MRHKWYTRSDVAVAFLFGIATGCVLCTIIAAVIR